MIALKLIAPLLAAATVAHGHALFQSRQLWATVDLCNAPDKPNTFGIRGSMPGDGRPKDMMFMRFRVQYLDAGAKKWVDLSQGGDSGFLSLGSASEARQAGRDFQFVSTPGKPAFTLRGVVSFQWRRGIHVVHSVSRVTTAGHHSLAGADPPKFSAAVCPIS
jgi:hypothetical protein